MTGDPHPIDRFAAFRAWRAEQKGGTYPFPAFGSEWEVPASMPARLWLWIVDMEASGRANDNMTDADAVELLKVALPQDVFAGWRELPISVEEMARAVMRLVDYYRHKADAEEPPGETPAVEVTPPPLPSQSSSTGDVSRPTSPASTGSTLPPPWSP